MTSCWFRAYPLAAFSQIEFRRNEKYVIFVSYWTRYTRCNKRRKKISQWRTQRKASSEPKATKKLELSDFHNKLDFTISSKLVIYHPVIWYLFSCLSSFYATFRYNSNFVLIITLLLINRGSLTTRRVEKRRKKKTIDEQQKQIRKRQKVCFFHSFLSRTIVDGNEAKGICQSIKQYNI